MQMYSNEHPRKNRTMRPNRSSADHTSDTQKIRGPSKCTRYSFQNIPVDRRLRERGAQSAERGPDPKLMSRRIIVLASLLYAVGSCSHAPPPRTATVVQQGTRVDPAPGINAADLRRDLFVFASDSFRGRETGTPDAQRAAAFIAR